MQYNMKYFATSTILSLCRDLFVIQCFRQFIKFVLIECVDEI